MKRSNIRGSFFLGLIGEKFGLGGVGYRGILAGNLGLGWWGLVRVNQGRGILGVGGVWWLRQVDLK
jgi:hypothetical protein